MLIVAVVETSPFDGLLWSNRLRLNCAKRGIIVCTISSMICTIPVYDKINKKLIPGEHSADRPSAKCQQMAGMGRESRELPLV